MGAAVCTESCSVLDSEAGGGMACTKGGLSGNLTLDLEQRGWKEIGDACNWLGRRKQGPGEGERGNTSRALGAQSLSP